MSRYENYEIKNNVFGTLSAPISSLATTIQLGDGQGQRFSVNQLATLENIENGKVTKREIVLITAINGDVLTVERKYAPCPSNDDANTQGQVSYAFSSDDTISAYIDKEHFDKIDDSINDIYNNGVNKLRTEVISGLQIKVNAGPVLVGSSYYDFEGGNLTLTDNATNYVEIDEDGNLVSNTTGRTLENSKVSKVITSGGEITNIEDWRLGTVGGKIGGTDIHELTEKEKVNSNDEIIIADSENIRQNKKVKIGNIIAVGDGKAIENISRGDMIYNESCTDNNGSYVSFGFSNDVQKISIKRIGNGNPFSTIGLYVGKRGTPNLFSVRIETDNNGKPSGDLIDANAYGTVSGSDVSTSTALLTVNMNSTITIANGTICHIVLAIDTVSTDNFFFIGGVNLQPNIFKIKQYNGNTRNDFVDYNPYFQFSDMYSRSSKQYGRACNSFQIKRYGTKDYIFFPASNYNYCFMLSVNAGSPASSYVEASANRNTGYSAARGGATNSSGNRFMYFTRNQRISSTMSTARDLSTVVTGSSSGAKYVNPSNVTNFPYTSIVSATVSNDGRTVYFGQSNQPIIHYMNFSTAFDVTSYQTYTSANRVIFSTLGPTGGMYGITISPDGKQLVRNNNQGKGYRAILTTARDITTAQYKGEFTLPSSVGGMSFNQDGYLIYDVNSNGYLYEYGSRRIYGNNIVSYLKCDGLADTETCKADKTMSFSPMYIPGAAISDFNVGETVKYDLLHNSNKTGLRPYVTYYLSNNGAVSTSSSGGAPEVGIAISPTILKLKQTYQ